MKRFAAMMTVLMTTTAFAGEAETSATAGSSRFLRSGNASATADYEGRIGFARADTRTGQVNLARGVAVGFDRDGLTLSVSNAVAPRLGPAVGTNFTIGIGPDGVSKSTSHSIAFGPIHKSVTVGGSVSTDRFGGGATSIAGGVTDRFGRVHASARSSQSRMPSIVRRGVRRLR